MQLAAVQSVVNQVNHSLNGMGIRKGREMGEERVHQGGGAQSPNPSWVSGPNVRLGFDGGNVKRKRLISEADGHLPEQ